MRPASAHTQIQRSVSFSPLPLLPTRSSRPLCTAEATGFTGPIYADPSLGLFKLLELGSSLRGAKSGERKGEYITDTFLSAVFKGAWVRISTFALDMMKDVY
jgi:hypothetical protein